MRPTENIKGLLRKLNFDADAQVHQRILDDALAAQAKTKTSNPAQLTAGIWRMIMKSKITKLAASAVIIIAVLVGTYHFNGSIDGTSAAFASVLENIQKHNYKFELVVQTIDRAKVSSSFSMQAMIMEPGRMRLDWSSPIGKISSISDLASQKTLILFHENKAGVMGEDSVIKSNTGILSLCTRPIANLWNLRNGSEENLGTKEMGGLPATGFRVIQEDNYFKYDMAIWAESSSGKPVQVEIVAIPKGTEQRELKWIMKDFEINAQVNDALFSFEVPEGYVLGYQSDLKNLTSSQATEEAKKIESMLQQWSEGKKAQAIESLLAIDWSKPIEFGQKPYIFGISEQEYIALKAENQKEVIAEVMKSSADVRGLAIEVGRIGDKSISVQDYKEAERYFQSGLELGKLLNREENRMIIVRLTGIVVEKKMLDPMIKMYISQENQQKLNAAKERLATIHAQAEEIKKRAKGE